MIFLSYAREDKNRVLKLFNNLIENGFEVWIDIRNILPGQKWSLEIEKAIHNSSLFLICLTKNSIDKRGVIQKEIRLALEYQSKLLDSDIFIIPCRLEECEIPDKISEYQGVDLFNDEDMLFLVNAIRSIETIKLLSKLDSIELNKNFQIEILSEYPTKLYAIFVKMTIILVLMIDDIESIKPYANKNLKKVISDFIIEELTQFMHHIDPERFYLRFHFSHVADEMSIENEIKMLLKNKLTEKFNFKVINIVIKQIDTDLTQRFESLISSATKLEFKVSPLNSGEELVYEGEFIVESVWEDGWHSFMTRNASLDEIGNAIERYLSSKLSNMPVDTLRYNDIRKLHQLKDISEKIVQEYVEKQFGLSVQLLYLTRARTQLETFNLTQNKEHEKIKQQIYRKAGQLIESVYL